ncbi:C-C motif chemokine 2-like [Protopterus annectens]|uniref:C-C motif chemokine 2-like n=1 Tax=Protopterus annectens TaxID=7888 RepID=UPI001CF9768C|nr:C-C motif chemokine 2-like [Protopterus annectens]
MAGLMHISYVFRFIMILGFALSVLSLTNPGKRTSCCRQVSKTFVKHIVSYEYQPEQLPCVEAIIFFTESGNMYCSNPHVKWVQNKVAQLNKLKYPNDNEAPATTQSNQGFKSTSF